MLFNRGSLYVVKAAHKSPKILETLGHVLRGWSLCEIMDQARAGFQKTGQQQRFLFPVEAGQDDYIKEI